jgi:hypothetical protein
VCEGGEVDVRKIKVPAIQVVVPVVYLYLLVHVDKVSSAARHARTDNTPTGARARKTIPAKMVQCVRRGRLRRNCTCTFCYSKNITCTLSTLSLLLESIIYNVRRTRAPFSTRVQTAVLEYEYLYSCTCTRVIACTTPMYTRILYLKRGRFPQGEICSLPRTNKENVVFFNPLYFYH